ncbi:SidA/IucD/PvdA family monooxygenase [Vibrio splendidus]|uniref:SidA/IucD/PvdA family monooxygenase n=1 Tax=Vibrio splendidus TaxID=29497 RepID=UPI0022368AC9|nr:SidA/IucD/PvdA family monooxygenase [Vibrio splendidus]MCW4446274.1 SidA/IucD/PvdA family monooxygenase [Vibrio splendidus]
MKDKYIILGGGPSAALITKRLISEGKQVLIISDKLGGSMSCMGYKQLQSYKNELDIKHHEKSINDYIFDNSLTPNAANYIDYITDCIKNYPIEVVLGFVSFIEERKDIYSCHVIINGEIVEFETKNLIIATGIKPRNIPNLIDSYNTINCFSAYQFFESDKCLEKLGYEVFIIGSGNSAFQIATSAYERGFKSTVLAREYLGVYPQENQDRFALRAPSQKTIEYIWKSQSSSELVESRFFIYSNFSRSKDCISALVESKKNNNHIARRCYDNLSVEEDYGNKVISINIKNSIVVSAIGTIGNLPDNNIKGLYLNDKGFVSKVKSKSGSKNISVIGTLAGARSINTMECYN